MWALVVVLVSVLACLAIAICDFKKYRKEGESFWSSALKAVFWGPILLAGIALDGLTGIVFCVVLVCRSGDGGEDK